MDKLERANNAVNYKRNGYNCCQAVAAALADQVNMSPEVLHQVTAGFAVGMGTMEATCGALIGANVIAGLKTNGVGTVKVSSQMLKEFESMSKATVCKDLKGRDTGVVLCPCEDCVKNAVLAYANIVGIE